MRLGVEVGKVEDWLGEIQCLNRRSQGDELTARRLGRLPSAVRMSGVGEPSRSQTGCPALGAFRDKATLESQLPYSP